MTVLKAKIGGQWVPIGGDSDYARWNSSWGVVAVGSFATVGAPWTIPASVSTKVATLTATTIVGRRYRLTLFLRVAMSNTAGDGTVNVLWEGNGLPTGGDTWTYMPQSGRYHSVSHSITFNGVGQTAPYSALINPLYTATQIWTDNSSTFYLEDIGPVSGAVPIPSPTPAWTPLTLTSPWVNFASGYSLAAYRKVGDEVMLRGLVRNLTAVGAGLMSIVAVLPVGYWPVQTKMFVGALGQSGTTAARIDVNERGEVKYLSITSLNVDYLSLDLIRYSTSP